VRAQNLNPKIVVQAHPDPAQDSSHPDAAQIRSRAPGLIFVPEGFSIIGFWSFRTQITSPIAARKMMIIRKCFDIVVSGAKKEQEKCRRMRHSEAKTSTENCMKISSSDFSVGSVHSC
jgi:hypothetical protein